MPAQVCQQFWGTCGEAQVGRQVSGLKTPYLKVTKLFVQVSCQVRSKRASLNPLATVAKWTLKWAEPEAKIQDTTSVVRVPLQVYLQ